jgi:hypothetical protein
LLALREQNKKNREDAKATDTMQPELEKGEGAIEKKKSGFLPYGISAN